MSWLYKIQEMLVTGITKLRKNIKEDRKRGRTFSRKWLETMRVFDAFHIFVLFSLDVSHQTALSGSSFVFFLTTYLLGCTMVLGPSYSVLTGLLLVHMSVL